MTREEAISSLITIKMLFDNRYAYEALDMAIEALEKMEYLNRQLDSGKNEQQKEGK